MVNFKYARAYTEVLEIIKYFPQEDYKKIPKEKIEFYKNNMDKEYNFIINPKIDLSEQNVSPEASAVIVNLFMDYLGTEEQKVKIKEILVLNQKKEELEKRKKYNPDNIFKNSNKSLENTKNYISIEKSIIEYKEKNFIQKLFDKIKHIFVK